MVILLLWYCCCGWRRYCCFDGVVFRTIDIDQSVSSICFVVAILSTNKHVSKQTTKQFYHSPFQLCACDGILLSSQSFLPFYVSFFYISSIMFLHSITLFVRTFFGTRRSGNHADTGPFLLLHYADGRPIGRGTRLAAASIFERVTLIIAFDDGRISLFNIYVSLLPFYYTLLPY